MRATTFCFHLPKSPPEAAGFCGATALMVAPDAQVLTPGERTGALIASMSRLDLQPPSKHLARFSRNWGVSGWGGVHEPPRL